MPPSTRPPFVLGAALIFGISAGLFANWLTPPTPTSLSPGTSAPSSNQAAPTLSTPLPHSSPLSSNDPTALNDSSALPDASEVSRFANLPLQKQTDALSRISQKFGKDARRRPNEYPPSLLLLLARATKDLSADQTAALLESLPSAKERDPLLTSILAAQLASIDPSKALDLGQKLKDPGILAAALSALAQKGAVEALKTAAGLPEDLRNEALNDGLLSGLSSKVAGSFREISEALLQNPSLLRASGIGRMLSASLADTAASDPAGALTLAREMAAQFEKSVPQPQDDADRRGRRSGNAGGQPSLSSILRGTLSELRSSAPEAASQFFDALSEKEKQPMMYSEEAMARFERSGIDAAVSFAEQLTDPNAMRSAATGAWFALAQKDKAAATNWIDSLPDGPFRQGVLSGVMVSAWNQTRTWGSEQTAVEAGLTLPSKAAQLDYFTNMMTDRPGRPFANRSSSSRLELIDSLPFTLAEKNELLRRVAPIRSK